MLIDEVLTDSLIVVVHAEDPETLRGGAAVLSFLLLVGAVGHNVVVGELDGYVV